MLLVSSLIVFTVTGYSHRFMQEDCASNRFYVFLFSLALGLNGAFLTGDIFNLFVWFEVMLLSSFVLITYGSRREHWVEVFNICLSI
jgi:multicomponent Na+:H+ antiporter subunit D